MTKARAPKVYAAEIDGLNDWIVAAPNRKAALDALGVRQDLFAQGMAREEQDPGLVAAARAAPGAALRRAKGAKGAFEPVTGPADWSAAVPRSRKARAKPEPDRRELDRAQARLAEVVDRHRRETDDIAEERARLDARQASENEAFAAARQAAKAAVDEAAKAYARDGGE